MPQLKASLKSGNVPLPNGIRTDAGTTVPTNGTVGYPKGSFYFKLDGGTGTTLYINEGTVSSANFNAVDTTD